MKLNEIRWSIVLCAFCILEGVLFYYVGRIHRMEQRMQYCDTIKEICYDTVRVVAPVAQDSTWVGAVYRTMAVRAPADSAGIGLRPVSRDTIGMTMDSVEVEVPISQMLYADSTYRLWISGYEPRLDSIEIYRATCIIRQTSRRRGRWSVGLQAGYGCTPVGLQPYVGIGFSYSLFSF